jgi:hypothetical protein
MWSLAALFLAAVGFCHAHDSDLPTAAAAVPPSAIQDSLHDLLAALESRMEASRATDSRAFRARNAELDARNAELVARVSALEQAVGNCCSSAAGDGDAGQGTGAAAAAAAGGRHPLRAEGARGGRTLQTYGGPSSSTKISNWAVDALRVNAVTLNVTDVFIGGTLWWHGRAWGPNEPTLAPTPMPSSKPTTRPTTQPTPTPLPTTQPTTTPVSCKALLSQVPAAPSGPYTLLVGGTLRTAYCDMATDGGGWTVVFAQQSGDSACGKRMTSDTEIAGNPLSFASYNVDRSMKAALSAISTESVLVRGTTGPWLKASRALFDAQLYAGSTANVDFSGVTLTASDGAVATGVVMGYAQSSNGGGGSYGIGTYLDHHSGSYYDLNIDCRSMFLYDYGSGGGSHKVSLGLGSWAATDSCAANCNAGFGFYAAMR